MVFREGRAPRARSSTRAAPSIAERALRLGPAGHCEAAWHPARTRRPAPENGRCRRRWTGTQPTEERLYRRTQTAARASGIFLADFKRRARAGPARLPWPPRGLPCRRGGPRIDCRAACDNRQRRREFLNSVGVDMRVPPGCARGGGNARGHDVGRRASADVPGPAAASPARAEAARAPAPRVPGSTSDAGLCWPSRRTDGESKAPLECQDPPRRAGPISPAMAEAARVPTRRPIEIPHTRARTRAGLCGRRGCDTLAAGPGGRRQSAACRRRGARPCASPSPRPWGSQGIPRAVPLQSAAAATPRRPGPVPSHERARTIIPRPPCRRSPPAAHRRRGPRAELPPSPPCSGQPGAHALKGAAPSGLRPDAHGTGTGRRQTAGRRAGTGTGTGRAGPVRRSAKAVRSAQDPASRCAHTQPALAAAARRVRPPPPSPPPSESGLRRSRPGPMRPAPKRRQAAAGGRNCGSGETEGRRNGGRDGRRNGD